jgi:hypothetical protein
MHYASRRCSNSESCMVSIITILTFFYRISSKFDVLLINSLLRLEARCLTSMKAVLPLWRDKKMVLIVSCSGGIGIQLTNEQAVVWVSDLRNIEMLRLLLTNLIYHPSVPWCINLILRLHLRSRFRYHMLRISGLCIQYWKHFLAPRTDMCKPSESYDRLVSSIFHSFVLMLYLPVYLTDLDEIWYGSLELHRICQAMNVWRIGFI